MADLYRHVDFNDAPTPNPTPPLAPEPTPTPAPAPEPVAWPTAPGLDPTSQPNRVPAGWRTFLIPIGAMAGHLATSLVVTMVFAFVVILDLMLRQGVSSSEEIASLMQVLMQQASDAILRLSTQIALIYSAIQLAIFIPLFLALRRRERRFYPNDRTRPTDLLSVAAIATGLVGLTGLLFAGLQALADYVPFLKSQLDYYMDLSQYFSGDGGLVWTILATCIVVPIAEEVIFRGVVMNEFRRVMPLWVAVVLQGVVFALFHMNFIQTLYVVVPGILLGAVYAWTRSLVVPIVMHICFNFLGAGLPMILGEGQASQIVFIVECAFILVAVLCVTWLHLNRRKGSVPLKDASGTVFTAP